MAPVLRTRGRHFIDPEGRTLWLRGANVGAASKVPSPETAKLPLDRHREVSYVDRPFPLEEADDHLSRLRFWGFNFLRITVTWEALEHAGHRQYDQAYLDYLRALLKLLPAYGMRCFVAMHQDVWSRLSGGSGAPGWTLEAVGFDLSDDGQLLETTEGAYLGGVRGGESERSEDRGRWPTGYQKLVAATMNTCFWAGDSLAPKLRVERPVRDGSGTETVGIQAYLQEAFLDAIDVLVAAVGGLEGVMGFELMNEPHPGYIGLPSLHAFNYNTDLHLHLAPSAVQSFALGAGHPQQIPFYKRSWPVPTRKAGTRLINAEGKRAWQAGVQCIWERMGVWGWDADRKGPVVLRETYFSVKEDGSKVDFYSDFYFPFVENWTARMRKALGSVDESGKYLFVENIPNEWCPRWPEAERRDEGLLLTPHWYDLNALFNKTFGFMSVNVQGLSRGKFLPLCLYFGRRASIANYTLQLRNMIESGYKNFGNRPQVLGELGVPMDLNNKLAFETNDFHWQERMMDALLSGLEANLVHFTLWNYNPANSDRDGDAWNGENFSWFSSERATAERAAEDLKSGDGEGGWWDAGGRLLKVITRPYPVALAGTPVSSTFDSTISAYNLVFDLPSTDELPTTELATTRTEIFFPSRTYGVRHSPADILIDCSEGKFVWVRAAQRLYHTSEARGEVSRRVKISVRIRGLQEFEAIRNRWLAAGAVLALTIALVMSPELRDIMLRLYDVAFTLMSAAM